MPKSSIREKFPIKRLIGLVAIACLIGLYVLNASWVSSPPSGRPTVISQRGVHQTYKRDGVDDHTCTAREILPPSHMLIDNTLPSIQAAFAAGADIVEVDTRVTLDHHFVLFHDAALDCRTNATGLVSSHTLKELKEADVGYGYTADSGRTFPLRGTGIGLMPTLEETLRANPDSRFLVQIKDGGADIGDLMLKYLTDRGLDHWGRLAFFGSTQALNRLRASGQDIRTWSAGNAARCLVGYVALGWIGHVPQQCDGGMVIVPVTQTELVWGWPNRFLTRMRAHQTEVMLIGRIDGFAGANFSRLDTIAELDRLPRGFAGSIWTDHVEIVGPALSRLIADRPTSPH